MTEKIEQPLVVLPEAWSGLVAVLAEMESALIVDADGMLMWANAPAKVLLGSRCVGKPLAQCGHFCGPEGADLPRTDWPDTRSLASGRPVELAKARWRLAGQKTALPGCYAVQAVPLPPQGGLRAVCLRIQSALEKDPGAFVQNNPLPVVVLRAILNPQGQVLDMRLVQVNEAAGAVVSKTASQLRGMLLSQSNPPSVMETYLAKADEILARDHREELDHPLANGRSLRMVAFRLDEEHIVVMGSETSAFQRKQEREKRDLEETRTLLESIPAQLWSSTPDGQVDMLNETWSETTGWSKQAGMGHGWLKVIHPEDRERVSKAWQTALANGVPAQAEARMRVVDGSYRWFSMFARPVIGEDGKIRRWYGINADLEEHKQVEQQLANAIERFRLITDNIDECFWIVNPQDHSQDTFSPAFERIMGCTPAYVASLPNRFVDLVHPDDSHLMRKMKEENAKGLSSNAEYRVVWANGETHWVREHSNPVFGQDGKLLYVVGTLRDTTVETTALRSLKESEQRFKGLAENMDEGFWLSADEEHVVYLSPAIERIFGKPASEFKSLKDFTAMILPEDLPTVHEAVSRQSEDHRTSIQFRLRRPNGTIIWVWDRSFPLLNADGSRAYTAGVIIDITAQKEAELAMQGLNRQLEERIAERTLELQNLYDNAPNGYHSLNKDGFFIRVNKTEQNWLGYTEEEMLGMHFTQILSPRSLPVFEHNFPRFKREGHIENLEFDFVAKDGTTRNLLLNSRAHYGPDGEMLYSYSTIMDNTSLKAAQLQVAQNSAKFQSLFENSIDAVFLRDANSGDLLDANKSAREMLGYSLEELRRMPATELMLEDLKLSEFGNCVKRMLAGERLRPELRTYRSKNGKLYPMEVTYSLIKDPGGLPEMVQYVCRDLAERLRAEAATQRQQNFARLLMDSIQTGVAVTNLQGQFEYANHFLAAFLGQQQQNLQGKPLAATLGCPPLQKFMERAGQAGSQGIAPMEVELIRHDGVPRQISVSASARVEDGKYTGSILGFNDITREKEIEQNLRLSASHLASTNLELENAVRMKDEFLASMSHELRTPLTGILGLSEVLLSGNFGSLTPKQAGALRNIESSGRHLHDLINDILDLSRMGAGKLTLNPELALADELCRSSVRLVEGMASQKNIRVQLDLPSGEIRLYCDVKRIKQTLVNLLSNAIKFTPDGGQVGLRMQTNPAGGQLRMMVWDTGIGIREEDQDKIFQPFIQLDSSLSRQFSGSGLGLALAEKFIQLHKGSLMLESEPNKGSTFTILLPWSPNDQARLEGLAAANLANHGATGFLRVAALVGSLADADENLAMQLRAIGMRVSTAGSLDELAKEYSRKANMVAMFLNQDPGPAGQGWQKAIAEDERLKGLSMMAFYANVEGAQAAQASPGMRHLALPARIDALRAAAEELLNPLATGIGAPNTPAQAANKPTILVVEDNLINREMMVDFLSANGFQVISAEDGHQAVIQVRDGSPQLVLMDIQMPGMDGLEATRQIRALPDPAKAQVPIIAVTALAMAGDREKVIGAGCNQYVSKPVNLPNLVRLIQTTLEN